MDDLSSEILLPIFKSLDSFEIVKIRPVCKKWVEIIDENRSVWRRPVLLKEDGWPVSTLELFDRKSQSTLKEVSFSPQKEELVEEDLLVQLLERSRESLRFLSIRLKDDFHFINSESPICELPWKIPYLIEFKLSYAEASDSRIALRWNELENSNNQLGSVQDSSKLKVLWGWEFVTLFEFHPHLLNNISSLCLSYPFMSSQWRRILEIPSKTLKHLKMTPMQSENDSVLSILQFPKLRVFQLWVSSGSDSIFDWMRIPTTSILICERSGLPPYLPSVSVLCLSDLRDIDGLRIKCPLLLELEVGRNVGEPPYDILSHLLGALILVLEERKQQSEVGFEVDGVEMTPLKRLVIPFNQLSVEELDKLRNLVEEVIDLESVSPFIEIEV